MNLGTTTLAFMRRDWLEARSYRFALAFSGVDAVVKLAVFFFIARTLGDATLEGRDLEAGYFTFVVAGLVLSEILWAALDTIAAKVREEQYLGTLEVVLAAPMRTRNLLAGISAFEFVRVMFEGALLFLVAIVLFGADFAPFGASTVWLALAIFASVALFLALGIAIAAATLVVKQTRSLVAFIAQTLAILGGVYFPLSVLPGPLRAVAELVPFTWAVDVTRGILVSGEVRELRLAGLLVAAAVALPASAWLFLVAARRARRDGSLVEY